MDPTRFKERDQPKTRNPTRCSFFFLLPRQAVLVNFRMVGSKLILHDPEDILRSWVFSSYTALTIPTGRSEFDAPNALIANKPDSEPRPPDWRILL